MKKTLIFFTSLLLMFAILTGYVDIAKQADYTVANAASSSVATSFSKPGFIGHGGCYYGMMNTEQAFIKAASDLKYKYIECDLKQTKDGVFVTCHDDTFGGYTLASTNWADLKDVTATVSRKGTLPQKYGETVGEYTSTICTLERYLEICKQYGVVAVIELKSSNGIKNADQSRMPALMAEIEKAGMLNQVILLGSAYNCLIWAKTNGYDYIPCQYLMNSCEDETRYNRCVQYGLDVSINITSTNSDTWIAKYQAAGLKVSTYTFSQYVDYPVLQSWIDRGVDFVTCDWQRPEMVTVLYNLRANADGGNVTLNYTTSSNISDSFRENDAFTLTFAPKPGYTLTSITRSDNVAVSYTANSLSPVVVTGTMPAYALSFNAVYTPMINTSAGLKTHSYDGYAVVSGFAQNSNVTSQLSKLNSSISSGTISASQLTNTNGTASTGTDGFKTNMSFTLNGVTYYTAVMGDTNSDGSVNIEDAVRAYSHIMGKTNLQNGELTAADPVSDYKINILDLMAILNQI